MKQQAYQEGFKKGEEDGLAKFNKDAIDGLNALETLANGTYSIKKNIIDSASRDIVELVTAIAMQYFKDEQCDIVVLEVGMGGALDSTNAIDAPEAAVITNIGLEHTEYLGDTLEKIAATKSGIIKKGCSCVCYDGEKVVTLDEKEFELNNQNLVICDGVKPVALAGIMGGLNSEIKDNTNAVMFEAAKFMRDNIRKSSRQLGQASDSSAMYAKGVYENE